MISIEEQLVNAQNQLIEWQKTNIANTLETDELTEKINFLENLHNWDQERLYETENKYMVLQQKVEEMNQMLNESSQISIEKTGTKQLLSIVIRRILHKITRR